ncbi:hypothetical protein E5Q_01254 [Mixia osmundae IAM 14324]|uniref:Uncharacterized protein n=1 Tax=Mixia osmundae (strain CBS 9802 / IAM 14324 / JCM 22182 / KY 12970) TaxID=764103 RepID=G7DVJ2_MIXOS|nr:hypothetical protein E5Q_01254 [Mixia osmundae IAM 14324]
MSNRSVPHVYRQTIDSTINAVRGDFEEMGIEDAVLEELQRLWEVKLATSRVADFTADARMAPYARALPPLPPAPAYSRSQNTSISSSAPSQEQALWNSGSSASTSATANANANGYPSDVKPSITASPKDLTATDAKTALGADEKPDRDEDAIDSDLDDPEDDEDDEEVAEEGGDLVIALYDKVQRVKNKWKIVLKDGIMSINGKDYLFSRCNGELEW